MRSAAAMGIATFFSRILGLVREQVFAYIFGAGNETDAYNIAFRIPNLLRDLFAEGAMSASLVPNFTQVRTQEGDRQAWRLAGLAFRVVTGMVAAVTILGMIFAPQLVSLYASAYRSVPGKFELTVSMTRTMFPFFPLVALAAAFMGILNACGFFFMPAFASALFNATSITVGVILAYVFGHYGDAWGVQPIQGMALGVVAGGLVQAACQLPHLYRAGYRWERARSDDPPWYRNRALRRMLLMMVPGTLGLAATQINILVNSMLATSQGTGPVSYLTYAFRLMQFPIGLFGVSLASATLPRLSQLWVTKNTDGIRKTLTQSMGHVLGINLPASAGLAFLAFPIIQLIFEHGRFGVGATRATAIALIAYSVGLSAYSAVKVLVPACYALGNTRIPVISSVLSVTCNIILNLLMVHSLGYWGLALGTSITAYLNATFLLFAVRMLVRRAGGEFPIAPILTSFLGNLGIALVMGAFCLGTHQFLTLLLPDSLLPAVLGKGGLILWRMLKVGVVIVEGAALVVILARIFRVRDTTEAFDQLVARAREKYKRLKSRKNKVSPGQT